MALFRRWLPEFLVLFTWGVLEILWALRSGPGLPVGVGYLPGVLLVLLAAGWAVFRLSEGIPLPSGILPGLAAGVLAVKLHVAAGFRAGFWPALAILVLPLLVVRGVRWGRGTGGDRRAWAAVLGVALVMSTDLPKVLWLRAGGAETLPPTLLVGAVLAACVGLWGFMRLWSRLRTPIQDRPRTSLAVGGLCLLAVLPVWALTSPAPGGDESTGDPTVDVARTERTPDELPNVVMISIDTLRWDMVPPHAGALDLPNLAALREDSLSFDHAFSETSWTLPAHVSLFTGLLPIEHGVQLPRNRIEPSLVLFPELLRDLGYRTAALTDGGYLSRRYGYDRGFDFYWQHPEKSPPLAFRSLVPGALEGILYLQNQVTSGPTVEWRHRFRSRVGRPNQRFLEPNLRVARRWVKYRGEPRPPFFMFLHTYEVHDAHLNWDRKLEQLRRDDPQLAHVLVSDTPLDALTIPSDTGWERFTSNLPPGMSETEKSRFRRFIRSMTPAVRKTFRKYLGGLRADERRGLQRRIGNMDDEEFERYRERPPVKRKRLVRHAIRQALDVPTRRQRARKRIYGYGVESVDESLGAFLQWLNRQGLYRDSLIVFLSDHGEGFHLLSKVRGHGKGRLSEVLTRVPLWIKLPGNRFAGRTIAHPVQLRDIFPMLLGKMGLEYRCRNGCPEPARESGEPLPLPERDHVKTSIAYQVPANRDLADTEKGTRLAVRGGAFKRDRPADGESARFWRVFADSLGQVSIRADSVPVRRRDRLDHLMEDYLKKLEATPSPFLRRQELDEELRRDLEGLGYL